MFKIIVAVCIDFIFGDPYNFPHPVRLMGKIIELEERVVRKIAMTENALKFCGAIIVSINILISFFVPFYILKFLEFNIYLKSSVEILLIYTCLAGRCLYDEAKNVKEALSHSLYEGRSKLKYIVGRDVENLSEEGVIRATVETVAENTSDGIIAPLFFIFLFGAPGGIMYKFVNTMDSMIAYKNDKYKDFGFFAAKTDDLFNLIPARLTGVLNCLSSFSWEGFKRGFRIMLRDHNKHSSPNAGWPEAAFAGILGIELGGANFYEGKLVEKPRLGDHIRNIEITDIDRSCKIMCRSELLLLVVYSIVYLILK